MPWLLDTTWVIKARESWYLLVCLCSQEPQWLESVLIVLVKDTLMKETQVWTRVLSWRQWGSPPSARGYFTISKMFLVFTIDMNRCHRHPMGMEANILQYIDQPLATRRVPKCAMLLKLRNTHLDLPPQYKRKCFSGWNQTHSCSTGWCLEDASLLEELGPQPHPLGTALPWLRWKTGAPNSPLDCF